MWYTNDGVLVSRAARVCVQPSLHVASRGAGGVAGSEARGLAPRIGAAQRAALLLGVHPAMMSDVATCIRRIARLVADAYRYFLLLLSNSLI